MKKVLVFGVFDGVHRGHKHFFHQAREYGDFLIVSVTPDNVVEKLKNKRPKKNIDERIKDLNELEIIDKLVEGDSVLGEWEVIKKCSPDLIAIGYDQEKLKKDIERYMSEKKIFIELQVMKSHKPHKYHSSILNYASDD